MTFLGFAILSAAAASITFVTDADTALARDALAVVLSGIGIAMLAGASLVFDLQKS